jgi:LPXTG-site transpeptidase (sortase) family protein
MNSYSYPVRIGLNTLRIASILFLLISAFIPASGDSGQTVKAQGIALPAEINKSFTPISIVAGQTSVLKITIFNPNPSTLDNTSWTDNLVAVQPGLRVADPAGIVNTCGGSVTADPGSTTIELNGGTVPAQVGSTPGSCTVSVNVTSFTTGNLINRIPSGALSATTDGVPVSNTDPASATLNVTGTPTPSVTKSFSPSPIWAGATSRLTVVIRNNLSTTSLTQASITDSLPANVFLADPVSPTLTGCGASASLTAVSGGTSFTLNDGTIAPNSTCSITVSVTSNEQGAYTNTIPAGALETEQGLTNATQATARLDVQELGVTKAFSPASFEPGEISTLTVTLHNPTDTDYTGVSVTDNLPAPMIVAGTATTTCGGTLSTTTNSVTLTGGTIPAGSPTVPGTCTISIPVTVPDGTPSGTLRNTIPAGAVTTDQGVGNLRPANANATVQGSDVLASKSFSPSTITEGGNSRLRIIITAPGDTDLTNFSVTDDLPAGITVSNSTLPSVSGCGPTPPRELIAPTGATSVSLTNGLILAGQQCRIDVYVTGSVAGSYTNTIPPENITNDEDRRPAGNITSTLNVTGGSTLSIDLVKGFDPLIVTGGASSTMSIQLINPGTATLTGIAFTDNMPSDMILANPVNFNVGTCGGTLTGTAGNNSFSFSGGSLPPLGTCTLTLSATMTVNGNLTNTIGAGAVTTDQGVTNADPVQASLTNLPGASISKSFAPNPIPANSYSLLTITIQNTGNIELVEMGMSDSLPNGLSIAGGSAPAPVNGCGGTLTAVSGTQLIQLVDGTLAGNSSCTIVVAITGSNPGDYQNTIPAGALTADPNTQNTEPATATLTITSSSGGGGGGGGSPAPTTQAQGFIIPVTGFAPGRVTQLNTADRPHYAVTGLTIDIPVLKVNTPIVGVESKNGNWDVSWLQNQAGWLNGTAYPTWNGNSVITGHVANADGKPGLFAKLKYLGVGEYIFVYNAGYRYTYKVVSNEYIQPNDASVIRHEEKSYLTLVTCDTYDEKTGTYLRRVAVRAVLVDVRLAR